MRARICSPLVSFCYEMATGTLPFRGDTSGTVFESILNKAPTSAVRLNPEIHLELERSIDKALEKARDTRYQHGTDLLADLKRLRRQTESSLTAAVTAEREQKFAKRIRLVSATAFLFVLVVAGVWYLRAGRAAEIDSIAVLSFNNVSGDASTDYVSEGITESLIASLAHVPDLKVKSRNSVFHYKGKDVDVQKAGKNWASLHWSAGESRRMTTLLK